MRTIPLALLAGFTLGVIAPAQAADLDYGVLRGPDYEPEVALIDWNGSYLGGHGGYTSASANAGNRFGSIARSYFNSAGTTETLNFRSAVQTGADSLSAFRKEKSGGSYGAYLGYNYQFEETVIGLEADYTRFDHSVDSVSLVNTAFVEPNTGASTNVSVAGKSTTNITDYGTVRVRAGYVIGNFLPFITGGVAIGKADISEQVLVNQTSPTGATAYNRQITATSFGTGPVETTTAATTTSYTKMRTVAGFALGGGVDFALTQNIILRGEYQYALFDDFGGHKAHLNTFRGGAAFKF